MNSTSEDLLFNIKDLSRNRIQQFISAFILCIVNIYTIYTILYKSQKCTGIYRWFQLDMVASAFILFLYISLFWTPFLLFPTLGCCTTGLLSYFFNYTWMGNYSAVIAIELLGYALSSALLNSVYRLFALFDKTKLLITKTGIIIQLAIKLLSLAPIIIAAHPIVTFSNKNQDKILAEIYPNLRPIYEETDELCVMLPIGYSIIKRIFLTFIGLILLNTAISFIIILVSIIYLNKLKHIMSNQTHTLHRQFLITLFLQLFLPFLIVIIPGAFIIYFTIFEKTFGTAFTNYILLITTTYPNWNCLALLFSSGQFRQKVITKVRATFSHFSEHPSISQVPPNSSQNKATSIVHSCHNGTQTEEEILTAEQATTKPML